MGDVIMVDMADLKVAKAPDALTTLGIGSCVAVCVYDPKNKLGGLAHIMLPKNNGTGQIAKYVDTAVTELLRQMTRNGASQRGLVAKLVGGASIFGHAKPVIAIGASNIAAVKRMLAVHNIRIIAENTGGNSGRSLTFHVETGEVEVRMLAGSAGKVVL